MVWNTELNPSTPKGFEWAHLPLSKIPTGQLSRLASWVVMLCAALTLGCGLTAKQKMVLADFSKATATVGDATSAEMKVFRDDGIRTNTQVLLLLGQPKEGAHLPTLESLDRGYELKRVQAVVRASDALAAYGKTMSALVNDNQTADLKQASTNLSRSIGQIPEVQSHLSKDQLDAFGTVVQGIGGLWVENKRKKAVEMLVERFSPAVDKLCDLLIKDFADKGTDPGWVYFQMQISNERLQVAASKYFNSTESYRERQFGLEAYQLACDLRLHQNEICSRISGAASAMKMANQSLVKAIKNEAIATDDLKAFADRAKDLKSAFELLAHK